MSKNKFKFILSFCILVFGFGISAFAEEQFVYDDKAKRNPFMPLVTTDGRLISLGQQDNSEINLEGIIYDEAGSSYAIVNQSIVRISDWVGDYRVLKIEKNKVIFLKDGQPIEAELKKEE